VTNRPDNALGRRRRSPHKLAVDKIPFGVGRSAFTIGRSPFGVRSVLVAGGRYRRGELPASLEALGLGKSSIATE